MKRIALWFLLLEKRLFKKPLFLAVLLLIPLMVLSLRSMATRETGILSIYLYEEPAEDPTLSESHDLIFLPLLEAGGLLHFEITEDKEAALEAVAKAEADALWVLPADLTNQLARYLQGRRKTPITIYSREETVYLTLAREKMYGLLHELLAQEAAIQQMSLVRDFRKVDKTELRLLYYDLLESNRIPNNLVRVTHLDDAEFIGVREGRNYLAGPLRGILALLILLTGFAVTLFFLQDKEAGILDWMPISHKNVFPLLFLLTGVGDAAIVSYAALYVSGAFTTKAAELPLMILYIFCVCGFCLLLSRLLPNIWFFGATIPVWLLACLILTPIFIDVSGFPLIQYLLPPYYYLNALHNPLMGQRMLLYAVVVCAAGVCLGRLPRRQ